MFLASLAVAWALTRSLIGVLRARGLVDVPNPRSSHRLPTPRGGGIAILVGVLTAAMAGWAITGTAPRPEILAGVLVIGIAGLVDDWTGALPTWLRLAVHLSAAACVVIAAGGLETFPLPPPLNFGLGRLAVPAALLWIVGLTNIYNFLDGIDGFAATQGMIAGVAVWVVAPDSAVAAWGAGIAGACAGFLPFNWHPARVFMGDIGSATLGFLLAAVPFFSPPPVRSHFVFVLLLCLWAFVADGIFTIGRRLLEGEQVWTPHRSHLYQRLVRSGLSHDRVVAVVCGAGASLAAFVVAADRARSVTLSWIALGLAGGLFALYSLWTRHREAQARFP